MGILNLLSGSTSLPEAGLSRTVVPGHFDAWVTWAHPKAQAEVFRVRVRAESADWRGELPEASWTFLPAQGEPFLRALEVPLALKEFLVGVHHAKQGRLIFTFLLDGDRTVEVRYELYDLLRLYRGRGCAAPSAAVRVVPPAAVDAPALAEVPPAELKARSEAVKQELAEKRRQAEEAAKKKAEEAAAAAKAAQAARAAAGDKGKAEGAAPAAAVDKSKPTLAGGRCAVVFGSSTGNTAEVARMLKAALGTAVDHVKNVTELSPLDFGVPEILILGIPTWHIGELQDDWAVMLPELEATKLDLKGKKVAIFGLGDFKGYPDTYVDAMMDLWLPFEKKGATLVGLWPTEGYDFKKSRALKNGKFLGLVIDVENQDDQSERRVKEWAAQLRGELF